MIINESSGRPEMLRNLIKPLISIDQYEPKIQHDSIVVVFEILGSYDAAYDLSSFIEKLPETTLDTEARETPNTAGDYLVFCEFERNADFPNVFMNILKDVEKISNPQKWNLDVYKHPETVMLKGAKTIKNLVRLVPRKELEEFLDYSGVTVSYLNEGYTLTNKTMRSEITVEPEVYFINEDDLLPMIQKYGITEANRVRCKMFPMHDVCQFVGTDTFLLEKDGKFLIMK